MSSALAHAPIERVDEDLTFDPSSGRLSLGVFDVLVPTGSDNDVVLGAYVDLVAQRRGHRPTAPVEVRNEDVDVLAELLDVDAHDIDQLIAEILGKAPDDALGLVEHLRSRKLALGLAAAAAGLVVLGSVALGVGRHADDPAPAPALTTSTSPAPPSTTAAVTTTTAAVTTTTAAAPRPSITETPDGVGLVEPLQQDAGGVGLAPAATDTPG